MQTQYGGLWRPVWATWVFGLLAIATFSCGAIAGEATPPSATPANAGWRFHEPVVLDSTHPPVPEEDEVLASPDRVRLIACQDRFVLALVPRVNSPKEARAVTLWSEAPVGVWQKLATVQGVVGTPVVLPLGRDVAVVANSREDKDKPRVWRISAAGEIMSSAVPMAPAPGGGTPAERRRRDRMVVRFGTAASQGESLGVFLLRGRNHGDTQEVLVVRSDDGGKTWQPEKSCGSIGYFEGEEGISGLVGYGDAGRSFGLLAADIKEGEDEIEWKPVQFAAGERPGTWRKEPLVWQDGLQQRLYRVPLNSARSEASVLALYGAFDPGGDQVRFCLTRSEDQGRTWSKGDPITGQIPVISMEYEAGLAAAGGHVAFSFAEQAEDAEYAAGRMLLSRSPGQDFEPVPLDRYFRGQIIDAPAVAATGDRMMLATQVILDPQLDPRTYLVVQEYSARSTPGELPLMRSARAQVRRLVVDLGAEDFESRQRAARQLATLGRAAKAELLEEMRSTRDAEVRTRLRLILGKLYPPCLQVN